MKKIFTLFMMALVMVWALPVSQAQNLVLNGGVEQWDDPNNPTDWDKAESISQETGTIHEGTYSAGHTSASGTQDFQQNVEGITAGVNYTISYWYFDNDAMARTRIWSYWLSGGSTIDPNADILRPNVYSTDNPEWQQFTTTLTAPAGADGFRFEVRVYKQDDMTGGLVFYDEFSITASGVSPEPANYPTDFAAAANGLAIDLTWTDAAGGQLPNGYLVLGSDEDNIQLPVDGNFVSDDPDLSDGSGALNIQAGEEKATFANLAGQQTYYFKIFPYTNGGANVDYKTDGSAPADNATTPNLVVIEFIDFNNGWENWTTVNLVGAQEWEIDDIHGLDDTPCAKMSGYSGGSNVNDDWLISPPMDFDMYTNEVLTFWTAMNYDGPVLQALISTDYDGGGDPYSGTWTDLPGELSDGGWEWTASGGVDVSGFDGEQVYLAFKYTSTSDQSSTWEMDDILLIGEASTGIDEQNDFYEVSVYPNPCSGKIAVNSPFRNVDVKIFSIVGEMVFEAMDIQNNEMIQLQDMNTGVYFITIEDKVSSKRYTRKLIVQ